MTQLQIIFLRTVKKMPYGTSMRRGYSRSTRAPARCYRKKVVAVPAKKRTTRTYTRSNAIAVNRLARDVRYLKVSQYGPLQKNLQVLRTGMRPTETQPCFFVANNITCNNPDTNDVGCLVYQLNAAGTGTTVPTSFVRNDNTYFNQMNRDILEQGIALVREIKMTFRIQCIPEDGRQISNKRVRIDMLKQKSKSLVTPISLTDVQQLPATSAQLKLQNLANPAANRWCEDYFDLIQTRFVYLNPSKTNATDKGTGASIKYVSMTVPAKYLRRPISQQTTAPAWAGDDTLIAPDDANWGISQMPINQRIWVCVSSDDPNSFPATDPELDVTCQRFVSWRDTSSGSSML